MNQEVLEQPAKKTAVKSSNTVIHIPRLDIKIIKITLIGDTGLICHAWSKKAKQQMLDKQMKKASGPKKAKDPKQDYLESLYPYPGGGYGFPATGFKKAAVDACSHSDGITKVEARGAFHVMGEGETGNQLVKIIGKVEPREDMVKIMMTTDIRYRGFFPKWSTELTIEYNANMLSPEQIANLFNTAGFAIGVGEWRPSKNGQWGKFHVK